jgi:amino acid transporter
MVIAIILQASLFKKDGIEVFGYLATIGSLAIIISYLFTSCAALMYFRKSKNIINIIIPILSIIALAFVLYSNIYPIPAFPTNLFIYMVLAWIAAGFLLSNWFSKENRNNAELLVEDEIFTSEA